MEIVQYVQTLPGKVEYAQQIVNAALAKYQPVIERCKAVDLTKLTNEQLQKTDYVLSGASADINSFKAQIEAERKPITIRFDQFRNEFTQREKTCDGLNDLVKAIRANIALEINKRNELAAEIARQETNKAVEEAHYNREVENYLMTCAVNYAKEICNSMYSGFYTEDINVFDNYFVPNIQSFDPSTALKRDQLASWESHFTFHFRFIDPRPINASFMRWNDEVAKMISQHRDELIKQIPERRQQILTPPVGPAPTSLQESLEIVNKALDNVVSEHEQVVAQQEISESVNASFESFAAESNAKIHTKSKVVYELIPSSIQHWEKIMAFWWEKQGKMLSLPELETKLSFMLKAANNIAQATDEWPGGVDICQKAKIGRSSKKKS